MSDLTRERENINYQVGFKLKKKKKSMNSVWWNLAAAGSLFFIGPHPPLLSDEAMVKPKTDDETLTSADRAPLV